MLEHSPLTRLLLVECCFTSTETVGLLGTEAQDGHLDFHTAPEPDTPSSMDLYNYIVKSPPPPTHTFWDLGLHQYLSRDSLSLTPSLPKPIKFPG